MRKIKRKLSWTNHWKLVRNAILTRGESSALFIVDSLAVLAIWLDNKLFSFGNKIYSRFPSNIKRILSDLNRSYLLHRNRIMKIEMESSTTYRRVDERGDVPGWVLVVLMTTGLVTALWTIAAPRLSQILKSSLDSMNNIR